MSQYDQNTEDDLDTTMRTSGEAIRAFSTAEEEAEGATAREPAGKVSAFGSSGAGPSGVPRKAVIPAGAGKSPGVPGARDFVSARAEATVGKTLDLESGSYTITKVISQNLTGEADIYLVRQGTEDFVYKLYRASTPPKLEVLERIKELAHPNVIRLLEYGETSGQFYEIMEYAAGGTLDRHAPIQDVERYKQIVGQAVEAFNYCHDRGLIHQDIKPENLFCRDNAGEQIMIADFGIASLIAEGFDRTESQSNLTLGYAAPEAYGSTAGGQEFDPIIGRETDYYALGITLLHLWFGRFPFKGLTKRTVIDQTRSGNVEIPEDMPRELQHLLAGLITVNYLDRWGYDEVKRWIAGENVPVAQAQSFQVAALEPYPFVAKDGETLCAHDFKEMASLMYQYPSDAIKRLYRGDIADWVRPVDPLLYHSLRDIVEDEFPEEDTAGRRKAIYLLDPEHGFISSTNEIVPKGNTIEDTLEAVGDYIESSEKHIQNVAMFPHEIKAYLDTLNESALAAQLMRDVDEVSDDKAVNRLIIALQGEDQLKIAGERFASYEDLRMADDEVKKTLVAQLHETDSKFLVWLELMGLKLDSESIDATHPAELADMLRQMPWIKLHDEKLRQRLNAVDAEGWSDLMKMAAENDIDTCRQLIDNGADVNQKSAEGATALSIAATSGYEELTRYLLSAGASPESRNAEGKTILHQTVECGADSTVAALLEAGALVNVRCEWDDWTPLRSAVNLGFAGIAGILLNAGADPNMPADKTDGLVPLHNAAADDSVEMVEILLRHNADPTGASKDGFTPLHIAARDNATSVLPLLLDAGLPIDQADSVAYTPLHYAVIDDSDDAVRFLLDRGADPNVGKRDCEEIPESLEGPKPYPLLFAVSKGNRDTAGLLLQYGADTEATYNEQTPAFMAIFAGDNVMVRMLLDSGARAGAQYPDGYSLLHAAVEMENQEVLTWLLDRGAPLEPCFHYSEDEPPTTPLVFAVARGNIDAATLLVERGAGAKRVDKRILDPAKACVFEEQPRMLEAILQAGFDPSRYLNNSGRTAWHIAASDGLTNLLEILCKYARGMNQPDKYGYTPVMIAAYYGHEDAVDLLLSYGAKLGNRAKNSRSSAVDLAAQQGNSRIAQQLAEAGHLKLKNFLSALASVPVKLILAFSVFYSLFFFSGRNFLMSTPFLLADTVPVFVGYLIWAFLAGHVAFWILYASHIRTARNYADWKWIKDPGGIGAMLKVAIKPGLVGVIVYLIATFFRIGSLPLIGEAIANSAAAGVLDQHLVARFLPEIHALFTSSGPIGSRVPILATYPALFESLVVIAVSLALGVLIGRRRTDIRRSMESAYS